MLFIRRHTDDVVFQRMGRTDCRSMEFVLNTDREPHRHDFMTTQWTIVRGAVAIGCHFMRFYDELDTVIMILKT